MLSTLRDYRVTRASAASIVQYEDKLREGYLPVGSVEFVREAIRIAGAQEPNPVSYPKSLQKYLHRKVECLPKYMVQAENTFIKPASKTKLFDGFLNSFDTELAPAERRFRLEQKLAFEKLTATTPIYVSEVVDFKSEWRYYILKDKIVGRARYDDGDDDAPSPSEKVVKDMVASYKIEDSEDRCLSYGLDVGVLSSGETALVEMNRAWALGLYKDMEDTAAYLEMLSVCWQQIMKGVQHED